MDGQHFENLHSADQKADFLIKQLMLFTAKEGTTTVGDAKSPQQQDIENSISDKLIKNKRINEQNLKEEEKQQSFKSSSISNGTLSNDVWEPKQTYQQDQYLCTDIPMVN